MVKLTSMSNPDIRRALESAVETAMTAKVTSGNCGSQPAGDSLAAKHLLVRGKTDTPLVRRFTSRPGLALRDGHRC